MVLKIVKHFFLFPYSLLLRVLLNRFQKLVGFRETGRRACKKERKS